MLKLFHGVLFTCDFVIKLVCWELTCQFLARWSHVALCSFDRGNFSCEILHMCQRWTFTCDFLTCGTICQCIAAQSDVCLLIYANLCHDFQNMRVGKRCNCLNILNELGPMNTDADREMTYDFLLWVCCKYMYTSITHHF